MQKNDAIKMLHQFEVTDWQSEHYKLHFVTGHSTVRKLKSLV